MASQYLPRTLTITVVGDNGTITIPGDHAGVAVGVSVNPPSGSTSAVYDFEVFDSEGFGQMGATGCVGPSTLRDKFQIHNGGSIDLTNASIEGDWTVRLWYEE